MAEHVVPVDVLTDWHPQAPHAVLVSDDAAGTALAVRAHPDDADQRCVVLVWQGSRHASMADEQAALHRLYTHGLQDVFGVGVVRKSQRVAELQPHAGAELVHHIVRLANRTVEVVAELLTVQRLPGPTTEAATAALTESGQALEGA